MGGGAGSGVAGPGTERLELRGGGAKTGAPIFVACPPFTSLFDPALAQPPPLHPIPTFSGGPCPHMILLQTFKQ